MTYKPRNQNPRIDSNRQSWSTAFDDAVARRKEVSRPCGFQVRDRTNGGYHA